MPVAIPIIDNALGFFRDIVNKIWPDKTEIEKQQIAQQMAEAAQQTDLLKGQLEINKAEAQNEHWFVSGARPFIMWVCGMVFAWTYILQPILVFIFIATGHPLTLPSLDISEVMPVLLGMLGLGAYRSYDKKNKLLGG